MNRKDFKGNVWRHLCAQAIERNCGYSGYHDRYALEWTVGVYPSYFNWDKELAATLAENDFGLTPASVNDITTLRLEELKQEWDDERFQSRLWDDIVENMRWGVTEADTYRTVRPEIAARYGLPYYRFPKVFRRRTEKDVAYHPAGKEGWVLESPYSVELYDVKWVFAGRGGKHLCLAEFEGHSLEQRSDDLSADITSDSEAESYSNDWCQKLLAFIHECNLCFTSKVVDQEFTYQLRHRLAEALSEALEASIADRKEAAERAFWEERDVMTEA